MKPLAYIAVAALTLIGCRVAGAQEQTLGRPDLEEVFVWRDSAANSEGLRLIQAGVHQRNPELVLRLMSCIVKKGTKAVVLDGGFASSTILVTSGAHVGCRGVVHNEDLMYR